VKQNAGGGVKRVGAKACERPAVRRLVRATGSIGLTALALTSQAGGALIEQAQAPVLHSEAAPALIESQAPAVAHPAGRPLRVRGLIGAGVFRSARAAGVPAGAAQLYLHELAGHLSLDDLLPSDTFDMIVEPGAAGAGRLLYAAIERDGRARLELLRWGDQDHLYDAAQAPRTVASFAAPVVGRVTSPFGWRRHPLLGYVRMHDGVDIGAKYGSPVLATADAIVAAAGWRGGYGNYVRLTHGGGIGSGYGHLSRIAVSAGMQVRRGEVIGFVGSTGLSTGPHLHYELYRDGRPVDPASVAVAPATELAGDDLRLFRARLVALRRLPVHPAARAGA
jgi:murein DD-endopeptidase MepM/ murein hydrolase activator NlpD